MNTADSTIQAKRTIRQSCLRKRQAQPDRLEWSRLIVARALALPEFQRARTVLIYLNIRTEVETCWMLPDLLESGQRIAVPWCRERTLGLFHLTHPEQLAPGKFGILEPRAELRAEELPPEAIDAVWVPGVAFDLQGGRLGYGAGYYDHLLASLRPEATRIGLGFACQVVPEVPREPHDQLLDYVITEEMTYPVHRL